METGTPTRSGAEEFFHPTCFYDPLFPSLGQFFFQLCFTAQKKRRIEARNLKSGQLKSLRREEWELPGRCILVISYIVSYNFKFQKTSENEIILKIRLPEQKCLGKILAEKKTPPKEERREEEKRGFSISERCGIVNSIGPRTERAGPIGAGRNPGNGCAFRRTVFWFRGGSRDMPRDVKSRKSTSRLPERRVFHDQNLPAEEAAPPKGTRLPQAYGYCERTQGACAPQSKGKGPPVLLTKGKAGGRAKPEKQAVGGSLVGRARRPFSLKLKQSGGT